MLKTVQFFHMWLFIFENQLFYSYYSYNRLFIDLKHLSFKNKKITCLLELTLNDFQALWTQWFFSKNIRIQNTSESSLIAQTSAQALYWYKSCLCLIIYFFGTRKLFSEIKNHVLVSPKRVIKCKQDLYWLSMWIEGVVVTGAAAWDS